MVLSRVSHWEAKLAAKQIFSPNRDTSPSKDSKIGGADTRPKGNKMVAGELRFSRVDVKARQQRFENMASNQDSAGSKRKPPIIKNRSRSTDLNRIKPIIDQRNARSLSAEPMQRTNGGKCDLNGTSITNNAPYRSPERRKGLQDRWPQNGFETKTKIKPDNKTHIEDKITTKDIGRARIGRDKNRRSDVNVNEIKSKVDENENLGSVENREERWENIETNVRNRKDDEKGKGNVENHVEKRTTSQAANKTSLGSVENHIDRITTSQTPGKTCLGSGENLDRVKDDKNFNDQLNGIGNTSKGKKDFERDSQDRSAVRSDAKLKGELLSEPDAESVTNRQGDELFGKENEHIIHYNENGKEVRAGTIRGNDDSDRTTEPIKSPAVDAKTFHQPNSSYLKGDLQPRTGMGISFRPFRKYDNEGKEKADIASSKQTDREGISDLGDTEAKLDSAEIKKYGKLLYAQPTDYSKNRGEMVANDDNSIQDQTVSNKGKMPETQVNAQQASDQQIDKRQMSDRLDQRNDKFDNDKTIKRDSLSPQTRNDTQVRRTLGIFEGLLNQDKLDQSGIINKDSFSVGDRQSNQDKEDVNKLTADKANSMINGNESIPGILTAEDHRHNGEKVISKEKTDLETNSRLQIKATSTKKNGGRIDEMDGCGKNKPDESTHGIRFQERGFMLVSSRIPGPKKSKVADLVNKAEEEILKQETAKTSQDKPQEISNDTGSQMLNSNSKPLGDQNQIVKETVSGKTSLSEITASKRATAAIRLDLKVADKSDLQQSSSQKKEETAEERMIGPSNSSEMVTERTKSVKADVGNSINENVTENREKDRTQERTERRSDSSILSGSSYYRDVRENLQGHNSLSRKKSDILSEVLTLENTELAKSLGLSDELIELLREEERFWKRQVELKQWRESQENKIDEIKSPRVFDIDKEMRIAELRKEHEEKSVGSKGSSEELTVEELRIAEEKVLLAEEVKKLSSESLGSPQRKEESERKARASRSPVRSPTNKTIFLKQHLYDESICDPLNFANARSKRLSYPPQNSPVLTHNLSDSIITSERKSTVHEQAVRKPAGGSFTPKNHRPAPTEPPRTPNMDSVSNGPVTYFEYLANVQRNSLVAEPYASHPRRTLPEYSQAVRAQTNSSPHSPRGGQRNNSHAEQHLRETSIDSDAYCALSDLNAPISGVIELPFGSTKYPSVAENHDLNDNYLVYNDQSYNPYENEVFANENKVLRLSTEEFKSPQHNPYYSETAFRSRENNSRFFDPSYLSLIDGNETFNSYLTSQQDYMQASPNSQSHNSPKSPRGYSSQNSQRRNEQPENHFSSPSPVSNSPKPGFQDEIDGQRRPYHVTSVAYRYFRGRSPSAKSSESGDTLERDRSRSPEKNGTHSPSWTSHANMQTEELSSAGRRDPSSSPRSQKDPTIARTKDSITRDLNEDESKNGGRVRCFSDDEEVFLNSLDSNVQYVRPRGCFSEDETAVLDWERLREPRPMIKDFNYRIRCVGCHTLICEQELMSVEGKEIFWHNSCFYCVVCGIILMAQRGRKLLKVRLIENKLHCTTCFSTNGDQLSQV